MERRKAHIPYPMRRQADDHCGWRTEGSRCRRKEDSKVLGRVPAADVQMPLCNSLPAARVFKLQSRDWREQEEAREKEGDLKFVWQLHWVEIIRLQFLTWFSNSNHELGSTTRGPRHTKTVVSFTVAPSGPNRQAQIGRPKYTVAHFVTRSTGFFVLFLYFSFSTLIEEENWKGS